MYTYRIELELRSGLGTPLAADALWGHVAWGIRYRHGSQALEAWLDRYDKGDPPLVISDPLPCGYFPRPVLPPTSHDAAQTKQEADAHKRLAKKMWVGHQAWHEMSQNVSSMSVERAIARSVSPPAAVEEAVIRAGINRLTGGTAQAEGGTLFTCEQYYFDFRQPPRFDVWALSPEPAETVEKWLVDGVAGGYGRDASAGLGHLAIVSVTPAPIPSPENPNACVLLGPAVPRRGDPYRGFFSCGVRCGRLGGDYAIGQLPGGARERHKRPVRCLLAGTVLLAHDAVPRYVGRVLSGVHPEIESIRHHGLAPVLPCRLAPELVERLRATTSSRESSAMEVSQP